MIGRLRGLLAYKQPPFLMIDVGGVGYEVEASLNTFARLPEVGSEVTLFTQLIVREDAHTLYGFAKLEERALFRRVIKVGGVGSKLALLILSGMSVERFSRCVMDADIESLTRMPGIGKKTAERLVMELKDKVGEIGVGPGRVLDGSESGEPHTAKDDAISALIALGYKMPEATRMIQAIKDDQLGSEELIRQALQAAVKG